MQLSSNSKILHFSPWLRARLAHCAPSKKVELDVSIYYGRCGVQLQKREGVCPMNHDLHPISMTTVQICLLSGLFVFHRKGCSIKSVSVIMKRMLH